METPDATKLTREELYELVWTTPLTTLAKNYNISDNGLRKICIKLAIPLPKSGYWSKIKFNKLVKKIPLPKNSEVKQEIKLEIRDENVTIEEHFQTAFYRLKKEIENTPNLPLNVPDILTKPDPLIIAAQKDLRNKKPSRTLYSKIQETIKTSIGIIDIDVSKDNVPRALRFMDTFIKLIKLRGYNIVTNDGSKVIVNGESIKIRFRETLKRIKTKDPDSRYDWEYTELIPSGILSFKIEAHWAEKEWRDSEKSPLETKLSNILAKLELEAERLKEERIASEIRHQAYERQRKIEEEQKRLFEKEINDFKTLKLNAKRWKQTTDIYNYINAIETNAINTNTLTEELKNYIKWAKDKADWYNPIIQKEDTIFKKIDPNKL